MSNSVNDQRTQAKSAKSPLDFIKLALSAGLFSVVILLGIRVVQFNLPNNSTARFLLERHLRSISIITGCTVGSGIGYLSAIRKRDEEKPNK